ncbi:MAG: hypothetical protein ABIV11_02540 [Gemmatimonadaceae bacterium]
MTFRRSHLRSAEAADARVTGTIDDRLTLVHTLSLAAWANGGKDFPAYDRSRIPVRIVRLGASSDRD